MIINIIFFVNLYFNLFIQIKPGASIALTSTDYKTVALLLC